MKKLLLVLILCIGLVASVNVDPLYLKSTVTEGFNNNLSVDFFCENFCQLEAVGDFFRINPLSGIDSFNVDVVLDDLSKGLYVGSIKSRGVIVPVVLEVNSLTSDFAVTIDVSSADKVAEEKGIILPKINLYNLKKTTKVADVSTFIYDFRGNIVYSDENTFSIEEKYFYTDSIELPSSIDKGDYLFAVVVDSNDTKVISSYFFEVVPKKLFKIDFNPNVVIILVIVVLLISMLGVVFFMFRERRNYFYELKRKHVNELKFYGKKIREQELASLSKVKTSQERIKIKKDFRDAKSKILTEMKKQHLKQKNQLKKMKSSQVKISKSDLKKINKGVYSRAVKSVAIGAGLKNKLSTLERAYDEGIISKDSLDKGASRIKKAHGKLKSTRFN